MVTLVSASEREAQLLEQLGYLLDLLSLLALWLLKRDPSVVQNMGWLDREWRARGLVNLAVHRPFHYM